MGVVEGVACHEQSTLESRLSPGMYKEVQAE